MTIPEDQLDDLKVVETYKEGVSVYKRPEHKAAIPSPAMFGIQAAERHLEDHDVIPGFHSRGDGCFNHGLNVLVNAINSTAE